MPLSAILTPVPHPGLVGPALAAARGGDPPIIATPASFPLRVATQAPLPRVDNPDPANPLVGVSAAHENVNFERKNLYFR